MRAQTVAPDFRGTGNARRGRVCTDRPEAGPPRPSENVAPVQSALCGAGVGEGARAIPPPACGYRLGAEEPVTLSEPGLSAFSPPASAVRFPPRREGDPKSKWGCAPSRLKQLHDSPFHVKKEQKRTGLPATPGSRLAPPGPVAGPLCGPPPA